MIDKDHLTTREKIMHAEKVGIVSRVHNIEKNTVMHCSFYTLCVIQVAAIGKITATLGKYHWDSQFFTSFIWRLHGFWLLQYSSQRLYNNK